MNVARRYCPHCLRNGPAVNGGANNAVHFILTILTVGFWIPVWLLFALCGGSYQCQQCGSRTYSSRFMRSVELTIRFGLIASLAVIALVIYAGTRGKAKGDESTLPAKKKPAATRTAD